MNGMTTYFNQYPTPQVCHFPLMLTEWGPLVPSTCTPPIVSVTVISSQIITSLCPYTGALAGEPVVTNIPTVAADVTPPICNDSCSLHDCESEFNCSNKTVSTDDLSDEIEICEIKDVQEEEKKEIDKTDNNEVINPIEMYLRLPKELFPTARMFSIDPNVIIEEFCRLSSISENVSWILDLEFGVPREPVTRAIAIYDATFNSIHCKNTRGAIHPGFEKCDGDFKRAILFYYDCVVSNWYNGYITLNFDKSVDDFQSWLKIPMQIFGLCWP